ncbi:MAG: hypothetical protein LC624_11930 [Halobacteriales archaeon]|nr:hypothetical protein [Halobacteriales archaeon]
MPRKVSKVLFYICNGCQAVFNDNPAAKLHWRTEHGAAHGPKKRGRPRKA